MAGSLEKRIADLERLYGTGSGNPAEEPEGWREKMALHASSDRARLPTSPRPAIEQKVQKVRKQAEDRAGFAALSPAYRRIT
jgi:hypothetical protein